MFAQRLAGHSVRRITRALNDAGVPCPSAADPKRNPHRAGTAWTLGTGRGDPGQPAVHRTAGVEPAAHRLRPGRPGQHRARARAGPAVEPARGLGHLPSSRAPGAGQRGRLHRRPGRHRAARPGRPGRRGGTCWPGCWPAASAAPGWIGLVQRQARLPVPPRLHQRRPSGTGRPRTPTVREDQILPHLAALGAQVRTARASKGLTLRGLARALDVSPATLSQDRERRTGLTVHRLTGSPTPST